MPALKGRNTQVGKMDSLSVKRLGIITLINSRWLLRPSGVLLPFRAFLK
jgi:hypothetical protein